jgi:hypothetical protein
MKTWTARLDIVPGLVSDDGATSWKLLVAWPALRVGDLPGSLQMFGLEDLKIATLGMEMLEDLRVPSQVDSQQNLRSTVGARVDAALYQVPA